MFFSPRSLQRRGDVVGHRHRRVVDELLVDHRDVALAHRHAGHVLRRRPAPGPCVGASSPAITRISVVLPAWVAPSSTVTAPRHQRQVERVQVGLRRRPAARPARASAPCPLRRRSPRARLRSGQCAAHQSATAARSAGVSAGRACCAATARRRRCAPTRGRAGSAARPRTGRARPRRRGRRRASSRLDARAVGARQPMHAAPPASVGWRSGSACTKRAKSVSGRRGRADPGAAGRRRAASAPRGPGRAARSPSSAGRARRPLPRRACGRW